MHEKYVRRSIYVRKKSGILLKIFILLHSLNPPSEMGFICVRRDWRCFSTVMAEERLRRRSRVRLPVSPKPILTLGAMTLRAIWDVHRKKGTTAINNKILKIAYGTIIFLNIVYFSIAGYPCNGVA